MTEIKGKRNEEIGHYGQTLNSVLHAVLYSSYPQLRNRETKDLFDKVFCFYFGEIVVLPAKNPVWKFNYHEIVLVITISKQQQNRFKIINLVKFYTY